jgi:hypothetical protein
MVIYIWSETKADLHDERRFPAKVVEEGHVTRLEHRHREHGDFAVLPARRHAALLLSSFVSSMIGGLQRRLGDLVRKRPAVALQ